MAKPPDYHSLCWVCLFLPVKLLLILQNPGRTLPFLASPSGVGTTPAFSSEDLTWVYIHHFMALSLPRRLQGQGQGLAPVYPVAPVLSAYLCEQMNGGSLMKYVLVCES